MTPSGRAPECAEMAAIRGRFLELLAGFRDRTIVLHAELQQSPAAAPALAELHAMAHRVAGIAATLGFEHLGQAAAALDASVTEIIRHKSEKNRVTDSLISAFIAKLEGVLVTDHPP